jgi:hypothetical protein
VNRIIRDRQSSNGCYGLSTLASGKVSGEGN